MPDAPVVRFAPSPTGFLHVGSAHSALANWMFARGSGGRFLLRIEDTDAERNRPELIENVLEMLRWLGLDWDGEPVHQSDRTDVHRRTALQMAADGLAYWCDCTAEQVQARAKERGGKPGYDDFCRDRGLAPVDGVTALRFRRPPGQTGWTDLVRGEVSFANESLEDFVLLRSNGTPVFLLANALDDAHMGITHVIRGEDHVNGTPKYLMILRALGQPEPTAFAHMPLLVNEGRKKLSKRRDDVSVADYRTEGFLREGIVNYLSLLGWGPPDGVEVRPIEEILDLYDLHQVNPSPAFFDRKKLLHVNAEWIRRLPFAEFSERVSDPRFAFLPDTDEARIALASIGPLVQERVRTLAEVSDMIDFLWLDAPVDVPEDWEKVVVKGRNGAAMLDAALDHLEPLASDAGAWKASAISEVMEAAAIDAGITKEDGSPQMAKASGPVRVATTGRRVGPPLWESLEVLGPDRTLERLAAARSRLG